MANCCPWLFETDSCNNSGNYSLIITMCARYMCQRLCVHSHFLKGQFLHFCSGYDPPSFPEIFLLQLTPLSLHDRFLPPSWITITSAQTCPSTCLKKNPLTSYAPLDTIQFLSSFIAPLSERIVYSHCSISSCCIQARG